MDPFYKLSLGSLRWLFGYSLDHVNFKYCFYLIIPFNARNLGGRGMRDSEVLGGPKYAEKVRLAYMRILQFSAILLYLYMRKLRCFQYHAPH